MTPEHTWTIANRLTDQTPTRSGRAATSRDAWLDGLAAGRAALLSGELVQLALTVDDLPEALYTPGAGCESEMITADLVELYQVSPDPDVVGRVTP